MDTAHLPIPRTNSELDHVKGSSDSGEKVDEERLSQAPYQNLQTHVHELESTRAYKMARWKSEGKLYTIEGVTQLTLLAIIS